MLTIISVCIIACYNASNINYAYARTPSLIIVGKHAVYTFNYPQIENYLNEPYLKHIDSLLNEICLQEKTKATNAELKFLAEKERFEISKERNGSVVDRKKLKEDILDTLSLGGGKVNISYEEIAPSVFSKDLQKLTSKRGEFTTYFSQVEGRVENIRIASNLINGTILQPNEVFSFNKVVGERSLERGFKMAKVIVDGKFVQGVGGGVCQVSTTLYNAALLAGLKIIEQHNHSLRVSYVENSFDAMVNSSSSDLKFLNDTNYPIYIYAKANGNSITFKIYGIKNLKTIKRESVVVEEISPKIDYVYTSDLTSGTERIVVSPKSGCKSQGYLIVTDSLGNVNRIKIRDDIYQAQNGITEVGENDN